MKAIPSLISLLVATAIPLLAAPPNFTYIKVDDSRAKWGDWDKPDWLRYFGLDARDINHDGFLDILSGRYVYLNPGGNMEAPWERIDLGMNTDGILFVDVDGDANADAISLSLPKVFWLEAEDKTGTHWISKVIAELPATGHVNSQGFRTADIVKGGKPEVLVGAGDGLHVIEIPDEAGNAPWPSTRLITDAADEGFAVGDVDRDGDLDLVASTFTGSGTERTLNQLFWWQNPGSLTRQGTITKIHLAAHDIDRIEIADLNGDGRLDIAYSEERYPGKEPDAELVWLAAPKNPLKGKWRPTILITQYSMNNLGAGDVDGDGDIDLVTNEHKGSEYKLQMFDNDGKGTFEPMVLDKGKEMHLGTQLADFDGDGDLDIYGHAWDHYKFLHFWRNDLRAER